MSDGDGARILPLRRGASFEERCIRELEGSDRAEWEELQRLDDQLAELQTELREVRGLFVEALLERRRRKKEK